MRILVLNSGSTSLKYKLFQVFSRNNLKEVKSGYIENIGQSTVKNHDKALIIALAAIGDLKEIKYVGHRVVHGGDEFIAPTIITKENIKKLEKYNKLAPLHNPYNLMGIKSCLKLLPRVKNVAIFDTAFHSTIPEHVFTYALPLEYRDKYKIRRYGFHGASHHYVAKEASKKLGKKLSKLNLITVHLGGGSSVSAIRNGQSVDTSMGFTPAEGLVMMTRSGDIDPAILLFLQKQGMSPDSLDQLINKQSGIRGLYGENIGFLEFLDCLAKKEKSAVLAFNIFIYRLQKYIAAYAGILGRVDAVIFTGSIGAGRPETRRAAVRGLKTTLKNVKIFAIKTDEEKEIAENILSMK